MNYTKPEVAVLGQAVRVIESHVKIAPLGQDFVDPKNTHQTNAAYDLDE